ncbi:MAG: hypothetical protein IPL23_28575 [Saprospiraceae bacterium]|nr:hypothetical protein [Saprospiraceae bacterium]
MIIKILWALIGLNTLALVVFLFTYLFLTSDKSVDTLERSWMVVLAGTGLVLILLAAVPLWYSKSTLSLVFSGIFAALPLVIFLGTLIYRKFPIVKAEKTYAETYYADKNQRAIASAIEKNDLPLLQKLIVGQDLNIQGTKVWDWPGLNYLQFAVRLRSNTLSFPIDEESNDAIIRLLIAHGSSTTPALSEAVKYVSPELISEMIDAGADPNTNGFVSSDPLLFELISSTKKEIDMAILLIKKGAKVDVKNRQDLTPVMYGAYNADTKAQWKEAWRLVKFLLMDAGADYTYTNRDGLNLATIIKQIATDAETQKVTMPADFLDVVDWLKEHDQKL